MTELYCSHVVFPASRFLSGLSPTNQTHLMLARERRVRGQDTHTICNATAVCGLQTQFVTIRAILFLVDIAHRQFMLDRDVLVSLFSIDQFDVQIRRSQLLRFDPGMYLDAFT